MLQLNQLARETNQQLSKRDIAEVNLACAAGLPGSEQIDVATCVRRLDSAARVVAQYTEHYLADFRKRPQDYENSEAFYRALALVTVLQRDLGIRYNPSKTSDDAKFDAEDTFIHGALTGIGGTCASLPVIYVAVGRRLGYPIRLVEAPCHLLCRWDEPGGARFNIEATNRGMNTPPDDYYRQGRYPLTPGQERVSRFFQSQTPREELAGFVAQRGYLWQDRARYKEAAESFIWASSLAPEHKPHAQSTVETLDLWKERIKGLLPPNFPAIRVNMPPVRRYPEVPAWVENDMIGYEATEKLLQDPEFDRIVVKPLWVNPQQRPSHIPQQVVIDVLN